MGCPIGLVQMTMTPDYLVGGGVKLNLYRAFRVLTIRHFTHHGNSILIKLPCVCLAPYFVKDGLILLFSPADT